MRGMIAMEMGFRFTFFTTLWHNQNNIHEEFFRIPELFSWAQILRRWLSMTNRVNT